MNFDNSYAALPKAFHADVDLSPMPNPELLAWNTDLARELGLEALTNETVHLARVFSGSQPLEGSRPIAMAYAGHQFGHFVPQLGDGRAALLGEVTTPDGRRVDIQLKGAGRTAFSRGGDGKSWLGPVLREYILSEAMHHLGVPTTRALAAVATGERVYRDGALPGAVLTRIADSHLRVGTFEFFAARGDFESLRILADYAVARHYPEQADEADPYAGLFRRVAERQAKLVAHWMAVGFIHGVMNTDNTTISGETIDYGPAAYLDEFRFHKVFSSIDSHGRYAYANQPAIAQWNLARLADTLLAIGAQRESLEDVLDGFLDRYGEDYLALMRPKLGIADAQENDAELVAEWLNLLDEEGLDYTMSFRQLASRVDAPDERVFGPFERRWRRRIGGQGDSAAAIIERMNSVNAIFIPRNHRVEQAIREAVEGDLTMFNELNAALANPYAESSTYSDYASPPAVRERVVRTYCGT